MTDEECARWIVASVPIGRQFLVKMGRLAGKEPGPMLILVGATLLEFFRGSYGAVSEEGYLMAKREVVAIAEELEERLAGKPGSLLLGVFGSLLIECGRGSDDG